MYAIPGSWVRSPVWASPSSNCLSWIHLSVWTDKKSAFEMLTKQRLSVCLGRCCCLQRCKSRQQEMHEAWNPFAVFSPHSAPLSSSTLLMADIRQFLPKNNQSISFQWLYSVDDNTRGTWPPVPSTNEEREAKGLLVATNKRDCIRG